MHLTPGQAHDLDGTDVLLRDTRARTIIADRAYDAEDRLRGPLRARGIGLVIPPKARHRHPRPYDRHLYQARHLIENFFARLKQYRAIATRYDKTAACFLGGIHLAAIMTWLN